MPNDVADCQGWTPQGPFLQSGNITDSMTSILELYVSIVSTLGHVHFSYRVDAELYYDGISFEVDGVEVLSKVSFTDSYVDFETPLGVGFHMLRWKYYKDWSISVGDDAAFIKSIEIGGLYYADDQCTPCAMGRYAASEGSSSCTLCDSNTFANVTGLSQCLPCPADQYSFPGAGNCSVRVACTTGDYEQLYTSCTASGRNLVAQWLEPKICNENLPNSAQLPATVTNQQCGACNPGFFRDQTTYQCVPCPNGYATSNSNQCAPCTAGTAAVRLLNLSHWDEWPLPTNMGCDGTCGTNGWRLRSSYIDSGTGHGKYADVYFEFNITLDSNTPITFTYQLNCSQPCKLEFNDVGVASYVYKINNRQLTDNPMLLKGNHTLRWTFSKYNTGQSVRSDRALIYSIILRGAEAGGAPSCVPCANGSISANGAAVCTNCTAGYSSDDGHMNCNACPAGTFTNTEGMACAPCGHGTTSSADRTSCVSDCTYTSVGPDGLPAAYDLNALKRFDSPYGPISASINPNFQYFLDVCTKNVSNTSCFDDVGQPLRAYACQINPNMYAKDLGSLVGFYDLPGPKNNTVAKNNYGLVLQYSRGDLGCGPHYGFPVMRYTNITFRCDPSSGSGWPVGANPVEQQPCRYIFSWKSIYACPLCSERDMSFYYTACLNGNREKHYYWVINPPNCHDGLPLPDVEIVNCSDSAVSCPAGTSLSTDGTTCVGCPAGSYSLGGGLTITGITQDTTLSCSDTRTTKCSNWVPTGDSLSSGSGNSAIAVSYYFRKLGSVSFNYKVYSTGRGTFRFSIDRNRTLEVNQSNFTEWVQFTSPPIQPGNHLMFWTFNNGNLGSINNGAFEGVSVKDITLLGIDLHDEICYPCPAGTYSTGNASECTLCPDNSTSTANSAKCTACKKTEYSLAEANTCTPRPNCTLSAHYQVLYTDCVDGIRTKYYSPLDPFYCLPPVEDQVPSAEFVSCGACPPQYYRTSTTGNCTRCDDGYYYTGISTAPCAPISPGNAYYGVSNFWIDDSVNTWPEGWQTGCSGECGTNGWRLRGNYIDSGEQFLGNVDSWITYTANITSPDQGSIMFTFFDPTTLPLNGLGFFVDGKSVSLSASGSKRSASTVSIPLSAGLHTLLWTYHQEDETEQGYATLRNIALSGVAGGANVEYPCPPGSASANANSPTCTPCAPGHYAPRGQSLKCLPCEKGEYARYPGASVCTVCPLGSGTAAEAATGCDTTCVFQALDGTRQLTYNLTDLSGTVGPVFDSQRRQFFFNVCQRGFPTNTQCNASSYVCALAQDASSYADFGYTLQFEPDFDNTTSITFKLNYLNGNPTNCTGGKFTEISFQCNPDAGRGTPIILDVSSDDCSAVVLWQSSYACPMCQSSDYQVVQGLCTNKQRITSYIRTSQCLGPASYEDAPFSCSAVEFPTGLVLGAIGAFLVVFAAAIGVFIKNRSISAKYSRLEMAHAQAGKGGVELE